MGGAIILVVLLVIVMPVGILMSLAPVAAILGWALKDDAEARHEGSELVETNY